jgi:hypothetical protein
MQGTTEKFISSKGDHMKDALETIDYKGFKIGIFQDTDAETPREDVWHWFDDQHSKGLYVLMGLDKGTK